MLKQTPKKRVLFVRRFTPVLLAFFGVFSLVIVNISLPKTASAATSNTVNFQARLQTAAGGIVPDGNYNVEFKLYSASSGGSAIWTEDYVNSASTGLKTVNGYLTANLGSITAFSSSINWDQQLYLTMNIGGTSMGSVTWDGEMNPRLPLTAVPYAFSAGQLQNTSGSNTSKLSIQAPTGGSQNFVIPDQGVAGTYNLLTANAADNSYIHLQGSSPGTAQTGNINISGTGIAGTGLQTPVLQSGSSSALTITGNASSTWSTSSGTLSIEGADDTSLNTTSGHTVGLGNNSVAQTIQIGNATGATGVTLTGGGAGVVVDGSGSITLGATSSTATITVGQATGSSSVIIGSNVGAGNTQTIAVGNSSTGTTDVTVGSTSGNSSLTLQAGAGDISFTGSAATNYSIGNSSSTGTITIGQSTANNTVNIANGLSGSNTQTVNIATSGSGTSSDMVTVGSLNGASSTVLQGGTGNVSLVTNNSAASVIARSNTNSTTAFQIQNASSVALFNVDTATATITFGTGGNTVTFTTAGGLVASGTARHTKQITLTPQYAGAVYDTTLDSNCTTANTGTMSNGYDNSYRQNYYQWTSSQSTSQCEDIIIAVPVPADFSSWTSSNIIGVNDYTTDTTDGTVNISLLDTTGTPDSNFNATGVTPGSVSTWTPVSSSTTLPSGTYTPGGYFNIVLRLTSKSGATVRTGNITLNYLSAF